MPNAQCLWAQCPLDRFIYLGTTIKNELEYQVTQERAQKLERALAALERDEQKKQNEPAIWQLHRDGS